MSTAPASRLASLRGADLRELHANGTAPDPLELTGTIDGAVLSGRLSLPVVRGLGLWRGKVFRQDETGVVVGLNRLGFGPLEVRRYSFTARLAPSLFDDREVLFLATSHHRSGDDLRYLCHFALAKAVA